MEQNILAAGKEELLSVRQQILELDASRAKVEELAVEEEKQERAVAIREKQISEEITETLKKRKEEIGASFREEEEKLRARQKKLKAKKEKFKNGKMSERIAEETSGLVEENAALRVEAKNAFRQSRTPRVYNTALYYGLFLPQNITDYSICLAVILLLFVAVPVGIYLVIPAPKVWYLVLIYLVVILLFGGSYVMLHNHSKAKYGEVLAIGRRIRSKIRLNRKMMAKIRRQIEKDKDESLYGLERFDQEILDVQTEVEEMIARQKTALEEFENTTKQVIVEEIRNRNQVELDSLKEQHEQTYQTLKKTQEEVKQKALYITENYEAFLGKEYVNREVLDRLVELLEQGQADTIGKALALYKEEGKV